MEQKQAIKPLYTQWGETIDRQCPLNDYPRPQLRRENWLCLNGIWQYAITDNDAQPAAWDGDILVPFSPECLLSGVGRQLLPGQTLWYSRQMDLPKPKENRRLILHFGAVDQRCRVWCNGELLAEHAGGYFPFSVDITHTLTDAPATLMLAVTDDSDLGVEAWGKQKLERGGIWYTGQSGIWQTVWCEEVAEEHIQSLRITPRYGQGCVELAVSGVSDGEVRVLAEGAVVAEASLKNGGACLALPDFRSWTPDDPYLYDLEIVSGDDKVCSYFGMREFGIVSGNDGLPRLSLNGKLIFHNGLLDQGYWSDGMYTPPSDEAMVWDISQMKRLGFNMLRKHIKIEPLRWYYHCDRLGMLVWQDFVSGGGPYRNWVVQYAPWLGLHFGDGERRYALHGRQSKAGRDAFVRDAGRTVDLLYNTVCLAMWVPFNEGWGQFNAAEMCRTVRQMDPTRHIDHASGYFDQGAGDLHSYHVYYKRFRPRKDKVKGRVLALTEFGGYSLPAEEHMSSEKPFGYKVFKNQEALHTALDELYAKDIFPAMKKGLGALVYTQVSDVEDEINGLVTYDRRKIKVDAGQIQAINSKVFESFGQIAGE